MTNVNHLNPGILQNPAHDIDRSIMAVKQRGGGYDFNRIDGGVYFRFWVHNFSFSKNREFD
jgi:hypothetical protein